MEEIQLYEHAGSINEMIGKTITIFKGGQKHLFAGMQWAPPEDYKPGDDILLQCRLVPIANDGKIRTAVVQK